MFCPKCGQQQPQDATRFCSRCGYEVGAVKALVGGEAAPDAAPAATSRVAEPVRSRKDVTKGAFFMFIFALCVAAATVDMPRSHSSRIFFLTVAWLALTLLINASPLVRYFFGGDASSRPAGGAPTSPLERVARVFRKKRQPESLPAAAGEPVGVLGARPAVTGEMVEAPPSVTDHTTNLLNRQ